MSNIRKKIIVVTTTLDAGGITSFLIPLVNLLLSEGHYVSLAYTKDNGKFLSRFKSGLNYIQYNTLSKKQSVTKCILNGRIYDILNIFFRKHTSLPPYSSSQRIGYVSAENTFITSEYYDIAISTAEGFCNCVVANQITANKKIGWVHPDMGAIGLDKKAGLRILNKLDLIVCVSQVGCNSLKSIFPNAESKFICIENIIDNESIRLRAAEEVSDLPKSVCHRKIVTVCRIDNCSKRLDRVIRICKLLKEKEFSFVWTVVGDGPDYENVRQQISAEGLTNELRLIGKKLNPLPYVKDADVFILTSQYEGKPVAVEEAKVLHKPIIVTEYTSAKNQVPKDMGAVVSNEDGILEEEIVKIVMNDRWINYIYASNMLYEYNNQPSVDLIKSII